MDQILLKRFIEQAIIEDIGSGDHTSLATIPNNATGKAKLLVKEKGIIAGVEVALAIFNAFDSSLTIDVLISDGEKVNIGDIVLYVSGNQQSILKAERLVLNTMQRMSGIATTTFNIVASLKDTQTQVLDTRKTTPNLRFLEKEAVKIGGGVNHRFGLYDMILIKDNHIDFAGGITKAIEKTKNYLKENNKDLKIIVEARDLEEVKEILQSGGVYRILLDNFDYEMTKEAVHLIGTQSLTESSGGINEETIRKYAECGVNYISSGALTHSVYNMDLSLKAI